MKVFKKESGFAHMMVVVVAALVIVGITGAVVYKQSQAYGLGCYPKLYGGGTKPCVRNIQEMVAIATSKSFAGHGGYDGIYGPYTKSVVKAFQTKEHITADGIVGRDTWNKLCSYPTSNPYYNLLRENATCPRVYIHPVQTPSTN